MALAGSQCLAGRRTTACFMLLNKTCSGSRQTYAGAFRSLNAAYYPALSASRGGKLTTIDRDNNDNNDDDNNNGGEVSSRGVTAATRRPACYPTTTTITTTIIAKLLRSTRLKVASRLTPGENQRCVSVPGGGGGGGHGVFLVRAYSGGNNNNNTDTGTTGAPPPPLYRTKTGYYDVLGVSPGAKPAQIKTAYYRQSFLHHPDRKRVAGEEAAAAADATRRFSDISEAYSVLGNVELKRKYDRGLLSSSDLVSSSSTNNNSTTTREPARSPSSVSRNQDDDLRRRSSVFDFDDFIKSHYGGQLQDRKKVKWEKEDLEEMESDASVAAFVALLAMISLALLLNL